MRLWWHKTQIIPLYFNLVAREGAIGAANFSEEFAEFAGVFDAMAGFDPAGDINGVGADGEDGFTDVFGSEAAGEDDFVFRGGFLRDGPIERLARTAELIFFRSGIEKEARSAAESSEIGHGKTGADAKSPDDGQIVFEIVELLRCFIAMELNGL